MDKLVPERNTLFFILRFGFPVNDKLLFAVIFRNVAWDVKVLRTVRSPPKYAFFFTISCL